MQSHPQNDCEACMILIIMIWKWRLEVVTCSRSSS